MRSLSLACRLSFALALLPVAFAVYSSTDGAGVHVATNRGGPDDLDRVTRVRNQSFNRYIVQFHADTTHHAIDSLSRAVTKTLHETHQYAAEPLFVYDEAKVFWGAAFRISSDRHNGHQVVANLQALKNVASVWPDSKLELASRPPTLGLNQQSDRNGQGSQPGHLKHLKPHWKGAHTLAPVPHNKYSADQFPPHVITGVDIQHRLGNFGQGVLVCIADTGVDFSHDGLNTAKPQGTPCIGEGCALAGGIDFIGEEFDGQHFRRGPLNYKAVQAVNSLECAHGTHTSAIVLANNTGLGYVGVVPQARFRHYKIYACSVKDPQTGKVSPDTDGGYTSIVLAAISQAFKDKCDVFTSSIGGGSGFAKEPTAAAASNLGQHIPVFFSSGNSGRKGLWTAGTPAAGDHVISVAASRAQFGASWAFTLDVDNGTTYGAFVTLPFSFGTSHHTKRKIYFTPEALESTFVHRDGCHYSEEDLPDLKDHVVIFFKGDCGDHVKYAPFYNKGARDFLAIWPASGPLVDINDLGAFQNHSDPTVQIAWLQNDEGLALRDAYLRSGMKAQAVFPGEKMIHWYKYKHPGSPADFSSAGPNWDGVLKPQISGVGLNYLSAVPLPYKDAAFSGTSMSCPHVAGIAALYKSLRRNATVDDIQSALLFTARPQLDPKDRGFASLVQGGAGMPNVTAMLHSTTRTRPASFSLGDSRHFNGTQILRIANVGKSVQTYTFGHQPANSRLALHELRGQGPSGDDDEGIWDNTPELSPKHADVIFSVRTMTLSPGEAKEVMVTFRPPQPTSRLKVYSGWLRLDSTDTNGSGLVPYAGVAGAVEDMGPFDTTFQLFNTTLPALFSPDATEQVQKDYTTFQLNGTDKSWPVLAWFASLGSEYSTCDLVHANISFSPTQPIVDAPFALGNQLGTNEPSTQSPVRRTHKVEQFDDVSVVARYFNTTFQDRDHTTSTHLRGDYTVSTCQVAPTGFDPHSAKARNITDGAYRVLYRTRKLRALDDSEEEYYSYLSRPFILKINSTDVALHPSGLGASR